MKLRIILHERNSLALDGVRDQNSGLSLGGCSFRKRRLERGHIMTVHLDRVPAEAAPLFGQLTLLEDILHEPIQLNTVAVYDRHDVVEVMETSEHGGFP